MDVLTELAAGLDPAVLFAEAVGHKPDPWQASVLRSAAPRQLLLCCRQAGKSTVVAVLALHTTLFVPASLTLLLSPSLRQSGELFRTLATLYGGLGRPVRAEQETTLTLGLTNGSRIVSLPGKEATVRGFAGVDLLIIDEAARVLDDLYCSVRPMLAVSGGRLVALSTPFGTRGWFFNEWSEGQGWERVKVAASDCPRISREFLAEEERSMGRRWFQQEYGYSFEAAADAVFSYEDVMGAMSEDVKPLVWG